MNTDKIKSFTARETGNDTQFTPEDAPFKVSASPEDIKLSKCPSKNYNLHNST